MGGRGALVAGEKLDDIDRTCGKQDIDMGMGIGGIGHGMVERCIGTRMGFGGTLCCIGRAEPDAALGRGVA